MFDFDDIGEYGGDDDMYDNNYDEDYYDEELYDSYDLINESKVVSVSNDKIKTKKVKQSVTPIVDNTLKEIKDIPTDVEIIIDKKTFYVSTFTVRIANAQIIFRFKISYVIFDQ